MRRYNRICGGILLVLSVVSLSVSPALAGIGKGNGEIGFDFGLAQIDDEVTDDAGGRFSIRGGYFFSDLFQLEGQATTIAVSEAEGTNVNISLSTFFVNAVFNFHPSKQLVPYALGGFGSANLEFSNGTSTGVITAYVRKPRIRDVHVRPQPGLKKQSPEAYDRRQVRDLILSGRAFVDGQFIGVTYQVEDFHVVELHTSEKSILVLSLCGLEPLKELIGYFPLN